MRQAVKFIPCFLTFLRVAAAPLLVFLILRGLFTYAVASSLFICLTDLLDGFIARKLQACTAFGALFDVYADLFYILISLLTLNIMELAPYWFTAAVIIKFLEFTVTSALLKKQTANNNSWVFDEPGRIFSAMAYLSPCVLCLAALYQVNVSIITYAFLLPACVVAVISSAVRITRCIKYKADSAVKCNLNIESVKEG